MSATTLRTPARPSGRSLWPLLSSLLLLLGAASAQALSAPEDASGQPAGDSQALERLAREPESTRRAVLEAATHPDLLVELQLLQARSSEGFRARVEDLEREDQEAIWEIAREPGLLEELAQAKPSREALEGIAAQHPALDSDQIVRAGARHHELLVELRAIGAGAEQQFEELIADLPEASQEAFRALVERPELLTLLGTHVRLAVELGDDYRADPDATLARLAALAAEVEQREAAEREEWVTTISEDPEAVADLEESARAYAEENGYAYEEVTDASVEHVVNVRVNAYPYWYGYPAWYAYSYYPWGYWYPRPVHFGYYYRPYRGLVFFGLPALHYVHWYGHRWYGNYAYRGVHRGHGHHGRLYGHVNRHPRTRHVNQARSSRHARRVDAAHQGQGSVKARTRGKQGRGYSFSPTRRQRGADGMRDRRGSDWTRRESGRVERRAYLARRSDGGEQLRRRGGAERAERVRRGSAAGARPGARSESGRVGRASRPDGSQTQTQTHTQRSREGGGTPERVRRRAGTRDDGDVQRGTRESSGERPRQKARRAERRETTQVRRDSRTSRTESPRARGSSGTQSGRKFDREAWKSKVAREQKRLGVKTPRRDRSATRSDARRSGREVRTRGSGGRSQGMRASSGRGISRRSAGGGGRSIGKRGAGAGRSRGFSGGGGRRGGGGGRGRR